jgi:hypothetical protein
MDPQLARELRLGLRVFLGLFVIDVVEAAVGIGLRRGAVTPLAILMLPAAWLILRYFMHIDRLRGGGER